MFRGVTYSDGKSMDTGQQWTWYEITSHRVGNHFPFSVASRKSCSTKWCTLHGKSCSIEFRLREIMFRGVTYSYGESCSIEFRLQEIMFRGVLYFAWGIIIECRLQEIMFRGVKYSACGILFLFRLSRSKEIMLCDICFFLRGIISIFSGGSPWTCSNVCCPNGGEGDVTRWFKVSWVDPNQRFPHPSYSIQRTIMETVVAWGGYRDLTPPPSTQPSPT